MQTKMSEAVLARSSEERPTSQRASAAATSPSVSVILPNYNHAAWLPRSLTALAAQNGPAKEIIVIDDGSTDDSRKVISDFCARYDCIRVVEHDRNRGIHAAMRSGIAAARGEFLLFAAADDFVLPDLLAHADAALRHYPDAAFYSAKGLVVDRTGRMVGYRPIVPPRSTSGFMGPAEVRQEIWRSDNWFFSPSAVYRRRMFAEIGYFDDALGSLCDGMALRLLAFRHGFYFDAQILAVLMIDASSLSARTSLSVTESRRVIDTGTHWIGEHFPADIRDRYRGVFGRRLRFNMARHYLVWRNGRPQADRICDLLDCGPRERSLMEFLARLPGVGSTLILIIMTLRMRPVSLAAIGRSWWRERVRLRRDNAVIAANVARICNGLA
jgi:glycosyltransferase involved in cell wall biosynthesis